MDEDDRKLKDRIRDKIREESGKLKLLSWKGRLAYVWDYYKPLMVAIIVIICAINLGITIFHNLQMDTVLSVYMVNCNTYYADPEEMVADYTEYIGGIGDKEEISFDTSVILDDDDYTSNYAYQMKFTAVISAKMADIVLMDVEKFEEYAGWSYFSDLREVLTDEELEKWSDLLVWLENEDGESIPCALDLTNAAKIEGYMIYSDTVYGGVVVNTEADIEMIRSFLEWILGE
ncbi:MAG: hypothetical protein LUD18_06805 [Lachnospiraceae bacterium]|nr:hypothetical protein [Lachnospiraceae bacterium]